MKRKKKEKKLLNGAPSAQWKRRKKIVLGKSQKREVKLFTNCEKVNHLRKKKVEHL